MAYDKTYVCEDFLTNDEMQHMIAFIDEKKAVCYQGYDKHNYRYLGMGRDLAIEKLLMNRANEKFPQFNFVESTGLYFCRYYPGASAIAPHKDRLKTEEQWGLMIYLNDFDGGELHFHDICGYYQTTVKPKKGDAILWHVDKKHSCNSPKDVKYFIQIRLRDNRKSIST